MRILIVFLIGLACAVPCWCADVQRVLEHDFGIIPSTAPVSYTFVFDEEVKSVVTLCDCVKASVVKTASAGKHSSSILVELDPASYQGPMSQEIFLLDKHSKRITLRVKAFVQ
ncbi:MAG: DUF1573 domain-containing protein [Candidatus Omnitrophota bacterium]